MILQLICVQRARHHTVGSRGMQKVLIWRFGRILRQRRGLSLRIGQHDGLVVGTDVILQSKLINDILIFPFRMKI